MCLKKSLSVHPLINLPIALFLLLPHIAWAQRATPPSKNNVGAGTHTDGQSGATDTSGAIGGGDDRSMFGQAINTLAFPIANGTTKRTIDDKNGLRLVGYDFTQDKNLIPSRIVVSFVEEDLRRAEPFLSGKFLIAGFETRTGQGQTVYAPSLLYSDVVERFDVGIQPYLGVQSGLGISFRYELTHERMQVAHDFRNLRNTVSTVIKSGQRDANGRFSYDFSGKSREEVRAFGNSAVASFVHTAVVPRVALTANLRFFGSDGNTRGGGINFSQLYPLGKNEGTSGISLLASARYTVAHLRDDKQRDALRVSAALVWQDQVPYIQNVKGSTTIAGLWTTQLGVDFGPKSNQDAASNIVGYIRLRDPHDYSTDFRLMAGRNYANDTFVGFAVTRGFSVGGAPRTKTR